MTSIENYDYSLPERLIAQQPLPRRADARLMLVDRGADSIDHFHVRDLPELLQAGDCLVLNDTRVLPAKLIGRRVSTGGRWQGLFLEKDESDAWRLLCKTRGKIQIGEDIMLIDTQGDDAITLRLVAKDDEGVWIGRPHTSESTFDVLQWVGRTPLPHYIRRGESLPNDREAYQTVFAQHLGSIAAPTAGLHFTDKLLAELAARGVLIEKLTLHVGAGTFRPIATGQLEEHHMHAEWRRVDSGTAERLNRVRTGGHRLIGVGTTTVRALETSTAGTTITAAEGPTNLFIRPPYEFKAVDGIMTNFHLPRSSLLVLIRTFAGDALIKRAYEMAIEEEYRFFSYGDAMLVV